MSAFRVHLTRTFIGTLAQMLVFTTWMVYQIEIMRLDALQLVLVGTAMEATIFLFEIPTGVLADVYSRRWSVIIGTALMGVGFLVMGSLQTFPGALVSQFLWGIGYTFTSGAYDAWLVDEVGQEQAGNAFLRGSQMASIAALVGIVGSVLLASIRLDLPILVGGIGQIGLALLLVVIMPETGFQPATNAERATWRKWFGTFADGITVVRGRPMLISILAIGFFFGFFSEAWDRLWQAHLIDNVGLPIAFEPVVWIGILSGVNAIFGVAAVEWLRRRLDTHNSQQLTRALTIFTAVMIAAEIGFALSSHLVAALVAYFAFNIGRGLIEPLFTTWTNQQIDSKVRATVLSMQSQTDAIGQITGGPPLGALGRISLQLAISASAVTLTPALFLLGRLSRRQKPEVRIA